MTLSNIPAASVHAEDGEPRVKDMDLATWLGFKEPRAIRELIARNRPELEAHGNLPCITTKTGGRGRPALAYHLNEAQALTLCALSRTTKAAAVRRALVTLFAEYRAGFVVDVQAHKRRLPGGAYDGMGAFHDKVIVPTLARGTPGLSVLLLDLYSRINDLETARH